MLKTATVQEIATRLVTKRQGFLCLTTRYYPRNLPKILISEYVSSLAPSKQLLTEFKAAEKRLGHNEAFKAVSYTRKFILTKKGLEELKRISEMSREKDVYLTCFCAHGLFCHRDLLLLMAEALFGAKIDPIKKAYGGFDPIRASGQADSAVEPDLL